MLKIKGYICINIPFIPYLHTNATMQSHLHMHTLNNDHCLEANY